MNKTMTITVIALVALVMRIAAVAPAMADPPGERGHDRAVICHLPDTPVQKTIVVDRSAVDGHLAHGDFVGVCPL